MMRSTSDGQLEASAGRSERRTRFASILLVLAATVILLFTGAFEPLEHRLTTIRTDD